MCALNEKNTDIRANNSDEEINHLKKDIMKKVEQYHLAVSGKKFIPGKSYIQNSGKFFDAEELKLGVQAVLDGWWTEGRFAEAFSKELSEFLPVKHISLVNSGSSANLVAFSSLTSHLLQNRLMPGDEVITVAAGFPTTVNPIIQNNCTPVFLDVNIETLTIKTEKIEDAITEKTKAIFLAHPLGNPFDLDAIKSVCQEKRLWLIEDACDALGSKYRDQNVGTFSDLSTFSFYPAHHMTMGEGGAIATNNTLLNKVILSIRDWGRDCWCPTGKDNTCNNRFSRKLGDLPKGYDHKFTYSHLGYNLKLTDMQAAIGIAQIQKLKKFIEARKKNFERLYGFFSKYSDFFYLPKSENHADPSWFGFPLTIKPDAPFTRNDILIYLNEKKIGTRLLFAGNITKQPYFKNNNIKYRVFGSLENTDYLMNHMFWVGIQPNITSEMYDYESGVFEEFFRNK